MTIAKKSILLIVIILIIDQVIKIWVKTQMTLGESIPVFGDWFLIKFVENPGMAFGIDIPGRFGKLSLSLFRLIAIIGITWYVRTLIIKKMHPGLIICLSFVLAGAIGNMIDSAFYGMIFNESNYFVPAKIFPEEGGYASFLHGRVVDMLYFPIFEGTYPGWFPFIGGNEFTFFRPIFNISDTSITIGVLAILLFQKRFFLHEEQSEEMHKNESEIQVDDPQKN
jgi:signal peptidase II